MTHTKVFLSAASSQFRDCCDQLASDLRAIGCEVIDYEHSYVSTAVPGFRQFLDANCRC